MPADLFYSTGQAARELGIAPTAIRALCANGAIECQTTPGGQYRVPKSAVEKMKRDGLPAVPRPLPNGDARPARTRHGHPALLADPSADAVSAADEVVVLENEVRSLGLRRQKEEGLDWFRERDEHEAQRQAEQKRAEARAEAEAAHVEWVEEWVNYALHSLPGDVPRELRPGIADEVRAVLAKVPVAKEKPWQPRNATERELQFWRSVAGKDTPPGGVAVRQLVDGAVARALGPWRRRKEAQRIIDRAIENLPHRACPSWGEDTPWSAQARTAATEAVAKLPEAADTRALEAAVAQAIAPTQTAFEHQQACEQIVKDTWMHLSGWNNEELEQGREAVAAALADLPKSASQRELERARDAALAPTQVAIDKRREQEEAERVRQREQEQAEEARQQDHRMRESVIQCANIRLPWGMSSEATEEALAEVREALHEHPEGTPRPKLDAAADRIVEQYKRAQERKEKKDRLIEGGLGEILPCLEKLEQQLKRRGEEFDTTTWAIAEEIKPAIREALDGELEGDESPEDVARLVRRLVREELGLS